MDKFGTYGKLDVGLEKGKERGEGKRWRAGKVERDRGEVERWREEEGERVREKGERTERECKRTWANRTYKVKIGSKKRLSSTLLLFHICLSTKR